MKFNAYLLAGAMLAAPAAWAGNCPNLMVEIDQILAAKPDIDEETIVDEETNKSVKQMREEGEQLHKQGKHSESVEILERAKVMLLEVAG